NAGSITESDGAAATFGTVSRTGNTSNPLTVDLISGDPGEATVPLTVTIPAGQASVNFDIAAVDDALYDGAQAVSITASASGFNSGMETLFVLDDDSPELTLVIHANSVSEG